MLTIDQIYEYWPKIGELTAHIVGASADELAALFRVQQVSYDGQAFAVQRLVVIEKSFLSTQDKNSLVNWKVEVTAQRIS
ncbi:hypothetical protein [Deinococcus wulumuqiensis]|uniref:Uncharacterized protein n=1 Tax=Deinococcus wulumuqiensis TaxID=980427 RepID=A0AAV4K283_9DEIO|nr:hypothetical protein [Deinococcus wulumuqiensis]QII20194.1 hypothetical protein G6R31_04985 [Deinococcus wulumuqiensis R12]GGI75294.1 hypothetical protein GCM10010914_06890 [Deinococcus wulumuqiensis]GGP28705.1 hypothetical protein GCM10008021_03560 [Deinococcus wulumuqiensis]